MGSLLRATGAFFMRRSFSATDSLYWDVFKEYVRAIVTEYHIGMEFFVEGTRSRSCKALPPKIGKFNFLCCVRTMIFINLFFRTPIDVTGTIIFSTSV